jgi:diguanylate cyclase (GGDEF)-like protein
VALFDVDHFKSVNDERGHAVGDEVLKAVAARLLSSVREGDFVARLGGDEFGLILANLPGEHAGKTIDRVRQQISASVVSVGRMAISVTASAGWSSIGMDDAAEVVLERADVALRAAKQRGRNRTEASERDANQGGEERTG